MMSARARYVALKETALMCDELTIFLQVQGKYVIDLNKA